MYVASHGAARRADCLMNTKAQTWFGSGFGLSIEVPRRCKRLRGEACDHRKLHIFLSLSHRLCVCVCVWHSTTSKCREGQSEQSKQKRRLERSLSLSLSLSLCHACAARAPDALGAAGLGLAVLRVTHAWHWHRRVVACLHVAH